MGPQTIAHYRITSKLGEGGMGAVYRATDTRLNRDVAIKMLPEAFATDPDRLARFTREAQVLASMNHPNIAAVYGIEERAIVMELVEGPTLADRIAQGPIPIEEALTIARQIAAALEAAHEKGIIHRDLKPANVKVTSEGIVKLLDFGLAKLNDPAEANEDPASAPTIVRGNSPTLAGVILGTAGYMSPEQARGKHVDKRADIWAFGVVFYEMLTGKELFGGGETVTDMLAAVVTRDPDWSLLPSSAPPALRRLLQRCLKKDVRTRLRDIGEARILLDEPTGETTSTVTGAPFRQSWVTLAVAVPTLAAIVLGVFLWRAYHAAPANRPLARFSIDLGPDTQKSSVGTAVLSPDGRWIVYPTRKGEDSRQLAIRSLDQAQGAVLPATDRARMPFFSPDSQWIGFQDSRALKRIAVQGGSPATVCPLPRSVLRGAAWGEDNAILFSSFGRLYRVPATGGEPEAVLPQSDQSVGLFWPQFLPGREHVLLTVRSTPYQDGNFANYDTASIEVLNLKTGTRKQLLRNGYYGRYLPSGHIVYVHQGVLLASGFDIKRLEVRGKPFPMLQDVASETIQGYGQFDFALDGTLLYLSGKPATASRPAVWMNREGQKTLFVDPPEGVGSPRLSPDGRRLAYTTSRDIVVYDPSRESTIRLTFREVNISPVWTPDGKYIVFASRGAEPGVWRVRSDGSGQPEKLLGTQEEVATTSISPDGRRLAFGKRDSQTGWDIWTLPLDCAKDCSAAPFLREPGDQTHPRISPDGRWIAYASLQSGTSQVFVRPFLTGKAAPAGGLWLVSSEAGSSPMWSPAGKELFYQEPAGSQRIWTVDYTASGDSFIPGKPKLWSAEGVWRGPGWTFDIASDGKRIVAVPLPDTLPTDNTKVAVNLLLNFFDELRRRVP